MAKRPAHRRHPLKAIEWQMQAGVKPDADAWRCSSNTKACFVLGTNINAAQLSDAEVIAGTKAKPCGSGFRFLKDPLFFVSSLFVKKPCRIRTLMVMTLALLVYSVAQRRLRRELARQNETIPNPMTHDKPSDPEMDRFKCGRH